MIWTVVALAEQGAYREDWGTEELDEYLQTLYPIPFDFKKEFVSSKPAAKRFLEGEVSTVDRYFVSGAQR